MLLIAAFSIASFSALSPTKLFILQDSRLSRMPAQEETKKLNTISSRKLHSREENLVQMEKDLIELTERLEQTADEIEHQKDIRPEIEYNDLFEIISEKKQAIERLKLEIANAKKEDKICKAEQQGEKLKTEIADLLIDKENILKEIDGLKVENTNLKTSNKKKSVSNIDDAPQLENSVTLLLMTQMTTMFTTQMQLQIQMQNQMLSMISQLQNNLIENANYNKKFPTLIESIDLNSKNIGLAFPQSYDYYNRNPYSLMPNVIPNESNQGYNFNQSDNTDLQKMQMTMESFSF